MSDVSQNDGGSPVVRTILMVVAVVYLIGSIIFMIQAQSRIVDLEKKQTAEHEEMVKKMNASNSQVKTSISVLVSRDGINQKDLTKKTANLQAEQQATQERLKTDEDATKQQIGAVT